MRVAVEQGLYDPDERVPKLNGTRCERCKATYFPPLGIGCEVCGAGEDELLAIPLAATGILRSVASVHIQGGKPLDTPFAVAEIQLDDGPLIRAMLVEPASVDVIGCRVAAQWVVVGANDDGAELVEPHFRLTDENESDSAGAGS